MGRSDDELPEIEVVGGADDAARTEVEVAFAPKRSRTPWLVGVAIVIALLATTAVINRDGGSGTDDEAEPASSTTERTTTTRGTTTTDPHAEGDGEPTGDYLTGRPEPVFGEPIHASLMLGTSGGGRWRQINLATGWEVDLPYPGLHGGCIVPVIDAVISFCQTPAIIDMPAPEPGQRRSDSHTPLHEARPAQGESVDRVLPSGRPDRVWIIATDFNATPPAETATLIDLDGAVLSELEPPGWTYTASSLGVIIHAGGRSYVVDEHGPTDLGPGTIIASSDTWGARVACGPGTDCRREIVDLATGDAVAGGALSMEQAQGNQSAVFAPDGSIAMLHSDRHRGPNAAFDLHVTRPDGRSLHASVGSLGHQEGAARVAWLPGDQGLVVVGADELLHVIDEDDGLVVHPRPDLDLRNATAVAVIPHRDPREAPE